MKQNKAYKHTWLKKFSAEDNISASIQNQCKTCSYTHHKHAHTKNIHAHTKNIHLVQQRHARKTHATNRTKKNKSKHKTKQSIQTYLAENQFVSAAARQCFSQHHKNNTKHTATSHAHTHNSNANKNQSNK